MTGVKTGVMAGPLTGLHKIVNVTKIMIRPGPLILPKFSTDPLKPAYFSGGQGGKMDKKINKIHDNALIINKLEIMLKKIG